MKGMRCGRHAKEVPMWWLVRDSATRRHVVARILALGSAEGPARHACAHWAPPPLSPVGHLADLAGPCLVQAVAVSAASALAGILHAAGKGCREVPHVTARRGWGCRSTATWVCAWWWWAVWSNRGNSRRSSSLTRAAAHRLPHQATPAHHPPLPAATHPPPTHHQPASPRASP